MSPSAKRVLEEALALPEDARTDVLEALIESLEPRADSPADVDASWTDEIARRLQDIETGAIKPIPWDEARKLIFGPRNDAPSR
jgi:putative addiction module component (TIGR02574 family)